MFLILGKAESNKEVKRKTDRNIKEKVDNCTKLKSAQQSKRKKSLSDNSDADIDLSCIRINNTQAQTDMNKKTKTSLKRDAVNDSNLQKIKTETIDTRGNIAQEAEESKTSVIKIENETELLEKIPRIGSITEILENENKSPIITSREYVLNVNKQTCARSLDEKMNDQNSDEKFDNQTNNDIYAKNQNEKQNTKVKENYTNIKLLDEISESKEQLGKIKEIHGKGTQPSIPEQASEFNTDSSEFFNEDGDLEWNVENMKKKFDIDVTDEDICVTKSETKIKDENDNKSKTISNVFDNSEFHEYSVHNSYTSKEYLSHVHDLAIAKCVVQTKPSHGLLNFDQKEASQINEDKNPTNEKNQNEIPSSSTSCPPKIVQSVHTRAWTGFVGGAFNPQQSLNIPRQRELSINPHSELPRLRPCVPQATPITAISGMLTAIAYIYKKNPYMV